MYMYMYMHMYSHFQVREVKNVFVMFGGDVCWAEHHDNVGGNSLQARDGEKVSQGLQSEPPRDCRSRCKRGEPAEPCSGESVALNARSWTD